MDTELSDEPRRIGKENWSIKQAVIFALERAADNAKKRGDHFEAYQFLKAKQHIQLRDKTSL